MDYCAPQSVEEAVRLLASDEEARCLAGGQTLVAMLNTRIIAPPRLVSLRRIPGLDQIQKQADGGFRIGAMVTHQTLADLPATGSHRLLPETARQIATPAIRAFGTIGGSLCHADAAADWPVATVALDASIGIAGVDGERTEAIDAFFIDVLTTSLAPSELVTHIDIPAAPAGSGAAYVKFARVEGDFATVSVAAVLTWESGTCASIRIAIGGCGPVPVRAAAAERHLVGSMLDDEQVTQAGKILASAIEPEDDGRASAAYRRMVVPPLVLGAVMRAKDAATDGSA